MKVICIDDSSDRDFISDLTKNKTYDVISSSHTFYQVINDVGIKILYPTKRFKLLREQNLENLLG